MARYHSPSAAVAADASGETLLVVAILRQAALDMQSRRGEVRESAERFWQNNAAVALWADLLDLDPAQLARAARRAGQ